MRQSTFGPKWAMRNAGETPRPDAGGGWRMAVDFMDGRTGWGVVRREFGAKATRQGTGRESRRRRHERGFRPRRMLRNMVRSRSTSGTVAAASRPREGQRDRGARRIREPPSRGEEDARGDREDGPRSGGTDRRCITSSGAVPRRRNVPSPEGLSPREQLLSDLSNVRRRRRRHPPPAASGRGPKDERKADWSIRQRCRGAAGTFASVAEEWCKTSSVLRATEEQRRWRRRTAEPACLTCTERPSLRAAREDWEATTIRDAREEGWRFNVTDAQIAEGILKGLSGSRSSLEDAGSFPTTVLSSFLILESEGRRHAELGVQRREDEASRLLKWGWGRVERFKSSDAIRQENYLKIRRYAASINLPFFQCLCFSSISCV